MAQVTPPPSGPPPSGPQGGPPPGGGAQPGGGAAEKAIMSIQQGFMQLGKMIEAAKGQLPPEDMKLFQQAASATDALIQSLTGGEAGEGPEEPEGKPAPGGPMPDMAKAGAQPAPQY